MVELSEIQKRIASAVVGLASLLAVGGITPDQVDVTSLTDALNKVVEVGFGAVATLAVARATVWGILKKLFGHSEEIPVEDVN